MPYCKKCGLEGTPGTKYCSSCGKLFARRDEEWKNDLEISVKPYRGMRILFVATVIFVGISLLIFPKGTNILKKTPTAPTEGIQKLPRALNKQPPALADNFIEKNRKTALPEKRRREDIMSVVNKNLPSLRAIYNKYLENAPNLKGKVTVKFVITGSGTVDYFKIIESSIDDQTFLDDLSKKIKKWRFRQLNNPEDVTEVVYPFIFSP